MLDEARITPLPSPKRSGIVVGGEGGGGEGEGGGGEGGGGEGGGGEGGGGEGDGSEGGGGGEGGGAGQFETVPETPVGRVIAKEQTVAVPETKTLNPFHAAYHNKFEWILHDANLTMPPPT